MTDLYSISDLKVHKNQRDLLQIPQLHLPLKGLTAIIGPNGAGKSTLLKALLGTVSCGKITCLNRPLNSLLQQGQIAWVGQHEHTLSPLSLLDYVLLGRFAYHTFLSPITAAEYEQAWLLLQQFELDHLAKQRLSTLSGGEMKRAALVRALLQQAQVLLLDEPTNHLDIKFQHHLLGFLKHLAQSQSRYTVVVLHDLALAANYADEIVLLSQGKLIAQGTPTEVFGTHYLQDAYQWPIQARLHNGVWYFDSFIK